VRYELSRPRWTGVPEATLVSGDVVTADLVGQVAVVTLNRPERRNTINTRVLDQLGQALRSADADERVRVIVLTGAGSTFCVGAEMVDDGESASFGGAPSEGTAEVTDWIAPYHLRKPVIAAINGSAAGAGLTLALQCDLRVVAREAKLALPFVKVGVIAEWMGHWTAVRLLGLGRAAELLLTGGVVDAETALQWGLANRVTEAAQVLPTALELADRMASEAAPVALAVSKRLLWEASVSPAEEIGRREHALLDALLRLPDAVEGPRAYLAKRPPHWTGDLRTDLPPWPS
jgi:enoyl-CoA hydratase/carnithine racemase